MADLYNPSVTTGVAKIFNVKDYGAKGDGTTDDTTALQAALTAGAGRQVFIPAGSYLVSAALVISSNTLIKGEGIGKTIIKINPGAIAAYLSGGQIFINDWTNGNQNIQIEDLEVYGATGAISPTQSGFNAGIYFKLSGVSNISLRRLKASHFNVHGFRIEPISNTIQYSGVFSEDCQSDALTTGAGISYGTNGTNLYVNRYTGGSRDSAVAVFEGSVATITNCQIDQTLSNSGQGIEFSTTQNISPTKVVISGNQIKGVQNGSGIYVNHLTNSATYTPESFIISSNTCELCSNDGIYIGGGIAVQVMNNICRNNKHHGINFLTANSGVINECSVKANTCYNNSQSGVGLYHGINVNGQASGTVSNSIFSDNNCFDTQVTKTQGYGISISGDNLASIVNCSFILNRLDNNATGTILPYGTNGMYVLIDQTGKISLGSSPSLSAQLDVQSTTTGFLPPRMTSTQRTAIASPAAGLMVWDTTVPGLYVYSGTVWKIATLT